WPSASRIQAYSEGIIEPFPLPVGPAWCAETAVQLEAELPAVRFGLVINQEQVDLAPYRIVRLRLRDGRHCGWLGVAAGFVLARQAWGRMPWPRTGLILLQSRLEFPSTSAIYGPTTPPSAEIFTARLTP